MSFVANFSAANLSLESLTRNYSAKSWRYETHEGRKYIVSPMTMIVPGVLNGSKGRLFYPEDEVGKDPTPWNGMPITHYHPSVDGKPVSANHEKAQEQHIGFVKKATSLGKLKAEAWVDIEKADARDSRIVQSVRNGNPMEISTGLYTDNFPAPKGSMWKGKPYDHVARNYRPDHLAILPDQKGACSLNDGCGLGINREQVMKPKLWEVYNNRWSQAKRDELDKSDFAGPNESFPIKTQKDVQSAAKLIGHADDPEAVKKRIISIAKRKGLSLPESWTTENMFSPAARLSSKMKRQQEKRNDLNIRKQRNLVAGTKQTEGKPKPKMPITDRKNAEAKATSKTSEGAARTKAKDAEITKRVEAKKLEMAQVIKKPAINSNPEGHNQYTGKSHPATEAIHGKSSEIQIHKGFSEVKKTGSHAHAKEFLEKVVSHVGQQAMRSIASDHGVSLGKGGKSTDMATPSEIISRILAKTHPTHNSVQFFITENAMSHEELRGKLDHALRSKLTQNDPTPYLHEVHDDHVKYEHGGEMKKCAYKVTDNDEVKVGKPKTLKRVTTYEEAEADEPEMNSNPEGHNQWTGKATLHVSGDTFKAKEKLKGEGFTWDQGKKRWSKTFDKQVHPDHGEGFYHGGFFKGTHQSLSHMVKVHAKSDKFKVDVEHHTQNQFTEDGIEPSTITPRKGGNMAKLTANQRTATIDKLTSNEGCGCFNEEDKDYLSGLSDTRLQALQAKHAEHTENADPDDDDEEEKVQTDNKEKKPVTNSKPKERMTINEFREIAPVEYLEAVDHAARITNAEKAKIVTKLTSHLKDGDVKKRLTANLSKQSLEALEDQLLLIPEPVKAAAPASRVVYGPTGNSIVTDDPVDNEEDDVAAMLSPRIDYVALSAENAKRN